jgi:DNA-binding SARP family transcriptional activator
MSILRVSLFGKFHLQCEDQTLSDVGARRVQELFCYLLLHRDRSHPRETLASLLWPESTTAQSMKYLRHTLWQLQTVLDSSNCAEDGSVIQADTEWVHLNPGAAVWLDVAEFERTYTLVQDTVGQELDAQEARALQEALALYQGDLLEGWYQDWCLFERERLQRMYLVLLGKRMTLCEAQGDYRTGLEYGALALRYDMAQERIHRRLMRLFYLAGERTAALRQYERCAVFLRQELDVAPSKRTLALYERIRSDLPLDPGGISPKNGKGFPTETQLSLPQALQRLKQLQAAFVQAQCQLKEVIQEVEMDLHGRD